MVNYIMLVILLLYVVVKCWTSYQPTLLAPSYHHSPWESLFIPWEEDNIILLIYKMEGVDLMIPKIPSNSDIL